MAKEIYLRQKGFDMLAANFKFLNLILSAKMAHKKGVTY